MENNYRKLSILSIAIFLGVFVSGEALGLVSTPQGSKANRKEKIIENRSQNQAQFCEGISERLDDLKGGVSEAAARIRDRKKERLTNWDENQAERDAKLAEFRSLRDANIEEHFKKLGERAKTDEQKQAVGDFEKAVREAIEARRKAIDTAIDAFRDGVQGVIDGRKTDLEALAGEYQSVQNAAFEKAKSDCANGANAQTVRNTLKTSLKAAHQKFLSGRKESEKARVAIAALIQTRKAAFEKAISDFKLSMEKSRVELKKAFPEG